jgi:hypothetical protein
VNIRDRHLLGRLEALIEAEDHTAPPDLASLSDEEIRARIVAAKHGAIYALRTGDYSHVATPSPLTLLSDEEIKRRLRVATKKIAAKKLAAEGVPARSIAGLLLLGGGGERATGPLRAS